MLTLTPTLTLIRTLIRTPTLTLVLTPTPTLTLCLPATPPLPSEEHLLAALRKYIKAGGSMRQHRAAARSLLREAR